MRLKLTCYCIFVLILWHGSGTLAQGVRPPITLRPISYTCEDITEIEFCSQLEYKTASFPNYRNQFTQMDADSELRNFLPLAESVCSNAVVHFLCAVYAPFCDPNQPQFRVPPCRELCEYVRTGCESLVIQFGLTWPPHLDCALYPLREVNPIAFCPENLTTVEIPSNIKTNPPQGVINSCVWM